MRFVVYIIFGLFSINCLAQVGIIYDDKSNNEYPNSDIHVNAIEKEGYIFIEMFVKEEKENGYYSFDFISSDLLAEYKILSKRKIYQKADSDSSRYKFTSRLPDYSVVFRIHRFSNGMVENIYEYI